MTSEQLRVACMDLSQDDKLIFFQYLQKLGARFYTRADNERWGECIRVHNGQDSFWVVESIVRKAYDLTINDVGNGKKVCNTGLMRFGGVIKKVDQ